MGEKYLYSEEAYTTVCNNMQELQKKYDVLVDAYNELIKAYNHALSIMTSTNNLEVF